MFAVIFLITAIPWKTVCFQLGVDCTGYLTGNYFLSQITAIIQQLPTGRVENEHLLLLRLGKPASQPHIFMLLYRAAEHTQRKRLSAPFYILHELTDTHNRWMSLWLRGESMGNFFIPMLQWQIVTIRAGTSGQPKLSQTHQKSKRAKDFARD